jgi:acyl phosphate:glycerol-3-phosphate acyltransferase
MLEIILTVLAYLLGSISTAVLVGKAFFNIDVREHGSGNAGATNSLRVLGKKAGLVVLFGDLIKGVAATKLIMLHGGYNLTAHPIAFVNFQIVLGIAAVLGHVFPIWANFRGGKGIATIFGMILAIQPVMALCLAVVFFSVLFATKYVSLSSMLAGVAFPLILLLVFKEDAVAYKGFAIAACLLVVITHHRNISRLWAGNENKLPLFGKKNKPE